jgi:hypothetical protein
VLAGKLDGRHITVRGQDYPVRMSSTPAGRNSVPRQGYAPAGAPGNPQLGEWCEGNTNCIPICPVQAKYSSLKTWYELMRRHPGDQPPTPTRSCVRIVPQAVATKVELDEHGRVSGITYQTYDDEAAPPRRTRARPGARSTCWPRTRSRTPRCCWPPGRRTPAGWSAAT